MEASRTIMIFTENREISQRPTSFVVSVLFHCIAMSLLSFGVMYTPHLDTKAIAERYTVRSIDLETPEQQARRAAHSKIKYPTQQKQAPQSEAGPNQAGTARPLPQPPVTREVAKAHKGPQTLVQPDLPAQLTLTQEIPVPTLMIWSPKTSQVKTVVAPQPEKPTAAEVRPRPDPPNQAVDLADVSIATIPLPTPKLPIPTSTTSPVAIHAPDRVQMAPATVSQPNAQPTPAAILSLSDMKMAQGKAVLPPLNETETDNARGALTPGTAHDPSGEGSKRGASVAGQGTGAGAGQGSGQTAGRNEGQRAAAHPAGASAAAAKVDPVASSRPKTSDSGTDESNQPSATQITLPRDGQFGAVVVGESLQEQYPELATVWAGRLAYTVFLHVGLARSWILQYSLPRSDEAAAAGSIARLEAPWPFNIVRPNFSLGSVDGSTIMIHGFVNQAGRFEDLTIVFPPQFPQAQFVLRSLQNWQFRPASQNGQPAKVEVLLIIPQQF